MKKCPKCGKQYAKTLSYCPLDGTALQLGARVDPLLGRIIDDRYRIDEAIGEGGIGIVYRAHHEHMPRAVALKILRREFTKHAELVARFQREVQTIVRIDHPNIVDVYDCGFDEHAGYYVAMRFLEGKSLAQRIDNGPPLTIIQAMECFERLLDACEAAHKAGVVHRDIKPDNIFLENDPRSPLGFRTLLLDFGLAKLMGKWSELDGSASQRITRAALAMGTPGTMSPEQIRGKEADERSDIYSLGCVFYELLTGRQVFEATTRGQMFRMHAMSKPEAPSTKPGASWIDGPTDALLLQMLAKENRARPDTIGEVRRRFLAQRHQLAVAWTAVHMAEELAGVDVNAKPIFRTHLRATAPGVDTVLVVEDEAQVRKLIVLLLTRNSYTVVECASGEEALMWLGANPRPAGVVLDLMMPGMDGATCLRGMRSIGYTGPVVVCTSVPVDQLPEQLRTANDVIVVDKVGGLHKLPQALHSLGTKPLATKSLRTKPLATKPLATKPLATKAK